MASVNPLPTKIKELRGTARADRVAKNEMQPELNKAIPSPSGGVGDDGKRMWWTFCDQLLKLGMLTKIGLTQIEAYCEYYDIWCDARAKCYDEKTGKRKSVIKLSTGVLAKNPYLKIMDEARKEMRYIEDRWGLNPSSQSKVSAPADEEDPLVAEFDL